MRLTSCLESIRRQLRLLQVVLSWWQHFNVQITYCILKFRCLEDCRLPKQSSCCVVISAQAYVWRVTGCTECRRWSLFGCTRTAVYLCKILRFWLGLLWSRSPGIGAVWGRVTSKCFASVLFIYTCCINVTLYFYLS